MAMKSVFGICGTRGRDPAFSSEFIGLRLFADGLINQIHFELVFRNLCRS
jgi:hypothetical protein